MTPPTLLIAGSESQWLKEVTEAVDDVLPNGRIVTFDGDGHAMLLTAPDRFTDEVVEFVRETE